MRRLNRWYHKQEVASQERIKINYVAELYKMQYPLQGISEIQWRCVAEKMLQIGAEKAECLKRPIDFQKGKCKHFPFSDNCFDAAVNCRAIWTLAELDEITATEFRFEMSHAEDMPVGRCSLEKEMTVGSVIGL